MKGWRENEKREKDGSAGRLIASIWLSYRYGSHKNQKSVSDEKLSEVCQTGGIRKFGYFKWWVMSDEWRKLNEEWWVMKKKKKPNSQFSLSLGLHFLLTGRMASPFISSSFPSFLAFTLLTSNHNNAIHLPWLCFSHFLFPSALL